MTDTDDDPQHDRRDFHDAREVFHAQVNQSNPTQESVQAFQDFEALFKRKNANVKRRITLTLKAIVPLESRPDAPFHYDDISSIRKSLKAADSALDALNEAIDNAADSIANDLLDPFIQVATDHITTIVDIRARVSHQESRLPDDNSARLSARTTRNGQNHPNINKIDNTFRPDPLEMNATPSVFQQWKDQFLVYSRRNGFKDAPVDEQRILIKQCLSPSMDSTLKRVCMVKDASSIDQLMKAIEDYVLESNNLMTRRYEYFNCVQKPGETIDDYIVRFRDIGDYASFDNFSYADNMACRLVTGILNEELRRELFRLEKPDFKSVQTFARTWEASNSSANRISDVKGSVTTSGQEVNKVSSYKSNKRQNFHKKASNSNSQDRDTSRQSSNSTPQQPCQRCGLHHPRSSICPATGQTCTYCNNMGHFSRVCRKARYDKSKKARPASNVNAVTDEHTAGDEASETDQPDIDQAPINVVDCNVFQLVANSGPTPKLPVFLQYEQGAKHHIHILPDTGAVVSVVPSSLIKALGWLQHITPAAESLRSVSGEHIPCDGLIQLRVHVLEDSQEVLFFVCPDVRSVILSWAVLQKFDVISPSFPLPLYVSQVQSSTIDNYSIQLYKSKLIHTFPTVFNQDNQLLPMTGDSMSIHLKSDVDWSDIKCTFKPRPIPVPLREATKKQLDDMLHKGIIIAVSEPTPFVSPMLVVPKKKNNVRLVVDYTELNKYVKRPIHPFPSVQEVKASIPPSSKFFATLDAMQGYWQVPLHPSSQKLTTFLTPWGRFCFTRAPMGLASSGDEYCRRGDIAFQGIEGVIKVVDDLLIHAPTYTRLKSIITDVLMAAKRNNITLSPDKFKIGTAVSFVGLQISDDGIRPDPRHTQAIAEFPAPKNKTDLRSFFGLVNQFASFSSDITSKSMPLRPLLSAQSQWHWSDEHDEAFKNVRKILVQAPVLQYFHPQRETKLLTDASRLYGLGFALLQKDQDRWALVACGSRFISPTESNYAVCELEALAIVWAIQKCRIYLMGLPTFTVTTDHRPLVSIFNSSRLVRNDNPRLVRLLQKVTMYTFNVEWIPGKMHRVPDALSRAPIRSMQVDDPDIACVLQDTLHNIKDPTLQLLVKEAKACVQYQDLSAALLNTPAHDLKKLPVQTHSHVRIFASIWDRLSIDASTKLILLDAYRIVVPSSSRKRILQVAHGSHQGISRTKSRLQSLYFWPGMANDVTQTIQNCDLCQKFRPSQPSQPLMDPKVPTYPFQATSCDLFEYSGSFSLVYVDRYSGWPLVAHFFKSPSSRQIINVLSSFFRDFGIPVTLRHDGGRQFISQEFLSFLQEHGVHDELSSAYHPQSNGHAEAAVKAIKLLVKKSWMARQLDVIKFNKALLEWRNTPRLPGSLSPAEILFKRKLRTLLPVLSYSSLSNRVINDAVHSNYNALKSAYHKSNSRKNALPALMIGDTVRIRNTLTGTWDKHGTVTAIRKGGTSYLVQSQGKTILRNRILLKKILTTS